MFFSLFCVVLCALQLQQSISIDCWTRSPDGIVSGGGDDAVTATKHWYQPNKDVTKNLEQLCDAVVTCQGTSNACYIQTKKSDPSDYVAKCCRKKKTHASGGELTCSDDITSPETWDMKTCEEDGCNMPPALVSVSSRNRLINETVRLANDTKYINADCLKRCTCPNDFRDVGACDSFLCKYWTTIFGVCFVLLSCCVGALCWQTKCQEKK